MYIDDLDNNIQRWWYLRHGRRRDLTCWSAQLSHSLLLHLSIRHGSCLVMNISLFHHDKNRHPSKYKHLPNTNTQHIHPMTARGKLRWCVERSWQSSRGDPGHQGELHRPGEVSRISERIRPIWPIASRQIWTNIRCLGTSVTGKRLTLVLVKAVQMFPPFLQVGQRCHPRSYRLPNWDPG